MSTNLDAYWRWIGCSPMCHGSSVYKTFKYSDIQVNGCSQEEKLLWLCILKEGMKVLWPIDPGHLLGATNIKDFPLSNQDNMFSVQLCPRAVFYFGTCSLLLLEISSFCWIPGKIWLSMSILVKNVGKKVYIGRRKKGSYMFWVCLNFWSSEREFMLNAW